MNVILMVIALGFVGACGYAFERARVANEKINNE
jgi:hypothetical protein